MIAQHQAVRAWFERRARDFDIPADQAILQAMRQVANHAVPPRVGSGTGPTVVEARQRLRGARGVSNRSCMRSSARRAASTSSLSKAKGNNRYLTIRMRWIIYVTCSRLT